MESTYLLYVLILDKFIQKDPVQNCTEWTLYLSNILILQYVRVCNSHLSRVKYDNEKNLISFVLAITFYFFEMFFKQLSNALTNFCLQLLQSVLIYN